MVKYAGRIFLVHDFFNRENITFALIKVALTSRTSGKGTMSKGRTRNPHCFQLHLLGISSKTSSRNNITLSRAMKIST